MAGPNDLSTTRDRFASFPVLLERHALARPADEVFVFLNRDGSVAERLDWERLAARVGAFAEGLAGLAGERVLLREATGPDFVAGFLACLGTRAIAVPVSPALRRPHLGRIIADCGARAVIGALPAGMAADGGLRRILPGDGGRPPGAPARAEAPAFLQYTSGSTGVPKGVKVRHGDLASNAEAIAERFAMTAEDTVVSWLPLYHDMGLIGAMLQTVWSGGRSVLMPAEAFVRRPAVWLESIDRFRGTVSGAPDFGYDLARRTLAAAEVERLDLSCWRAAFDGADMLRAEVLDGFSRHFAPAGFDRRAFLPCYGLAEATLLVAAEPAGGGAVTARFDRAALHAGRAQPDEAGVPLVASGLPAAGTELRICDPASGRELGDGRVGEIEVRRGSIAGGYWARDDARFGDGRLKTGDLGFLWHGRLFVLGRGDDMIVLRGRNLMPGDIEAALAEADGGIRAGQVAVLAVGEGADARLVAVVDAGGRPGEERLLRLRAVATRDFGVALDDIVWTRRGALPRTTSGKLRRSACWQRYLDEAFPVLARSRLDAGSVAARLAGDGALEDRLCRCLAAWCGLPAEQVAPDRSLADLGLDSLALVQLLHGIETALGCRPGLDAVMAARDIADLARIIEESGTVTGGSRRPPPDAPGISPRQSALWLVQDLDMQSAAYTIAQAVRLTGLLQVRTLSRALDLLVDRHAQLRVNFELAADGVRTIQHPPGRGAGLRVHDLPRGAGLDAALSDCAARPFDLARDRLFRFDLFRVGDDAPVLLLAVHHAVCDLWSLAILVGELARLLDGETLPPVAAEFADHLAAQADWLASPAAAEARAWYRAELSGELPQLALGQDRVRPARPGFRGTQVQFALDAATGQSLARQAAAARTTLQTLLLAAWTLLLRRVADQDDVLVGVPIAGRGRAFEAGIVGYLVDMGVVRNRTPLSAPFTVLLEDVARSLAGALRHGALPLAEITAAAAPERVDGHSALFRSVFNYNGPGLPGAGEMALSGLVPGRRFALGPVVAHTMTVETATTQFDLTCTMASADADGALAGALQYDSDLFDRATIEALAGAFRQLLHDIARRPDRPARALALVAPAALRRGLAAAHGPRAAAGTDFRLAFERQVRARPDAVAVRDACGAWSYGTLSRWANSQARELTARGVGPGDIVAVSAERGAPYLGAMLAIAKAGACYMPLSPRDPAERLAAVLGQARPAAILSDAGRALPAAGIEVLTMRRDPVAEEIPDPPPRAGPLDPCYVLFTSGSTGVPKGAMVHYQGSTNHLEAMIGLLSLGPGDAMAQTASVASDISVWQFLVMVCVGGRVEVIGDALNEQPAELLDAIGRRRVTVLQNVPAVLEVLAEELERPGAPPPPAGLRWVSSCGEALSPALARRWMRAVPGARLINAFGPAECSDDTSVALIGTPPAAAAAAVSIGTPLRNMSCHVLDRWQRPVPPGVTGELWIGGIGVGLGYLGDPGRTAEAFRPDPFSDRAGARLYRTGDLARLRPDGELEYHGRRDSQVKIRGFRVEIGEIEAALARLPGVRHAAVALRRGHRPELVAWVAPAELDLRAARRALAERLPAYMLPDRWVPMPVLPVNQSGKIDRKALPDPPRSADAAASAAETPEEALLAAIWQRRLDRPEFGRDAHFFEVGGHSLLAIQVIADVRASLGVRLSLRDVFQAPRLSDLSERIVAARRAGPAGGADPGWPPARTRGQVPLSAQQRRMRFLNQIDPEDLSYTMTGILRFDGAVDRSALKAALGDLVTRHDALRTVFETAPDGRPVQRVTAAPPALVETDRAARDVARAEAGRGFDLTRGPVLRLTLARAREGMALVVATHHIVFDGWSIGVFMNDLAAFYRARRGDGPAPPPLPFGAADHAAWSDARWSGRALDAALAAWTRRFGARVAPLDLPFDRAASVSAPAGRQGTRHRFEIPAELGERMRALAVRQGVTPFLVLMAGFQVLLSRWTGKGRFSVGTLVAGRDRPGLEALVGLLMNAQPVPADLSDRPTGAALLERLRRDWLDLSGFAELPYDAIVGASDADRSDPAQAGLNVFLVLQNQPAGTRDLGAGQRMTLEEIDNATAPYDLICDVEEGAAAMPVSFRYATGRFEPGTMAALADGYLAVLQGLCRAPGARVDDLPVASPAAARAVAAQLTGPRRALPADALFPNLFHRIARTRGAALAASDPRERLSHAELDRTVDRVAAALMARGVAAETVVGVHGARSVEMLIALLAILRAGGAYLPLDRVNPPQRLAGMVREAGARLVLTCGLDEAAAGALAGRLCCPCVPVAALRAARAAPPGAWPVIGPDRLAYAIYTSGSTGKPKGAMVSHLGMLNHLWCKVDDLGIGPDDIVAETAPQGFDISIWQFLSALLVGGATHVLDEADAVDPARIPARLAQAGVTIAETVPSLLREIAISAAAHREPPPPGLRWMLVTGEAVPADTAERWLRLYPGIPLMNAYGPTECSDDVTHHVLRAPPARDRPVPIGRPLGNTRLYILDPRLDPLPQGAVGRLWVGGIGVGRGYVAAPGKTAAAFRPDPFSAEPGQRMYDTGDIVRLAADGTVIYLGRADQQIKLAGRRIELGEIEAVLETAPGVRDAAVGVPASARGQLAAYLVPEPGQGIDPEAVRAHAAERLPRYMLPAGLVILDALPRTANGKLDRSALPDWTPPAAAAPNAPLTPTGRILADLAAEVTARAAPPPDADFFTAGGDSLQAMRLIALARRRFGVAVPLARFYRDPTLAALALAIDAAAPEAGDAAAPADPSRLSLSPEQERLWFLEALGQGEGVYTIVSPVWLTGPLDRARLDAALTAVLAAHPSLRATVDDAGDGPVQAVRPPAPVALGHERVAALDPDALARREAARPFDLRRGPPVRCTLYETEAGARLLMIAVHHMFADGSSMDLLLRDLVAAYGGQAPAAAPIARWLAMARRGADGAGAPERAAAIAGAAALLEGLAPWLDLPADRPDRAAPDMTAGVAGFRLGPEALAALDACCRAFGATRFMVLSAVFAAVLGRVAGREDFVFGTDVAGRHGPESEGVVGFLVNQIPIRLDLSGNPDLGTLVARSRAAALAAFGFQDVPFQDLVRALRPERRPGRMPIFQIKIIDRGRRPGSLTAAGLAFSPVYGAEPTVETDLLLEIAEIDGSLAIALNYRACLFDHVRVCAWRDAIERALAEALAAPGRWRTEDILVSDPTPSRPPLRPAFRRRAAPADPPQEAAFPAVIRPPVSGAALAEWLGANRAEVEAAVCRSGAVVFRGAGLREAAEFEAAATALCDEMIRDNGEHEPIDGSAIVQTPVRYPSEVPLRAHNENTFNRIWPGRILFACLRPADSGGATTALDGRRILASLPAELRTRFEREGIVYRRVYQPGLERRWQDVFGTEDEDVLAARCRAEDLELSWIGDVPVTEARRPAVAVHPVTGERSWVAQVAIWHPACHDAATTSALTQVFGAHELPRTCRLGAGGEIGDDAAREIAALCAAQERAIDWAAGDMAVLDNLLCAHGRQPYRGQRQLLVALSNPVEGRSVAVPT